MNEESPICDVKRNKRKRKPAQCGGRKQYMKDDSPQF
jgi:hypothetical protein